MMLEGTCFQADTLDDLLADIFPPLLQKTEFITARKGRFTEIVGAHLVLTNPRARLSRSESKGKVFSALGEFLWYMSGENAFDFIDYYVPHGYDDETEDRVVVNSGYGKRLFSVYGSNQIARIIRILKDRPTSRQAVIQIFAASDLEFRSVPCTCTLQFLIREGRLNLLVNMRSNDAYWGLPHDIFAFTMIQELISRSLGVGLGQYMHVAGSLHLYEDKREKAQTYICEGFQNVIPMQPMPQGDQSEALAIVRTVEKQIREEGRIELEGLPLADYWFDICVLLAVHNRVKNKDFAACQTLRGLIRNKGYYTFIDSKMPF